MILMRVRLWRIVRGWTMRCN